MLLIFCNAEIDIGFKDVLHTYFQNKEKFQKNYRLVYIAFEIMCNNFLAKTKLF